MHRLTNGYGLPRLPSIPRRPRPFRLPIGIPPAVRQLAEQDAELGDDRQALHALDAAAAVAAVAGSVFPTVDESRARWQRVLPPRGWLAS